MKIEKIKLINAAMLTGFGFAAVGFWTDIAALEPIGLLVLGFVFVVFHREIGTEQLRLYNATLNKSPQTSTSKYPTAGGNGVVVLIVGIGFLIGGALTAATLFLS